MREELIPLEPADEPGGPVNTERTPSSPELPEDPEVSQTGIGPIENEALDWKESLRNSFDDWLESVEDIPEVPDDEDQTPETTPDLFSFYAALTAMASENRKVNRKFAEALGQWQEGAASNQAAFEQVRSSLAIMASEHEVQEKRLSRAHCLALVEILDRMRRLSRAFTSSAPAKTWWGRDEPWRKTWNTQGQAFDILIGHFESLLKKEGVVRMETVDQPFDPLLMIAVAAEPDATRPHQTVVEEIAAGYLHNGDLLRVAQVKVTTRN
jgi:molecular chaperone GrpE (heat shock protein)